eukprot:Phypoly_transcript_18261.p1 GENE.Phypoly_transcript_18261~~Phypoly_transcript_18261.p1  ORF type:complete len:242 (+),score=39.45 Phypoly_transcript_18261:62-727(+)
MSSPSHSEQDLWKEKWNIDKKAGYTEPFSFTEKEATDLRGKPKVIIIPGNGVDDIQDCIFYSWIQKQIEALGIPCICTNFPDPMVAREEFWKGFITKCIGVDHHTILLGHSSGSACAMRIAEEHNLKGVILLAAYHTDLGDSGEKESGYFDRPWQWEKIKQNVEWIVQFHSKDDHLVPVSEARFVAEKIGTEYHELNKGGHFQKSKLPDVLDIIKPKLQSK